VKNIPIYEIEKVWHVGILDKSLKGTNSLEGSGLSVSECPLVWEEIAELGGKYYELTKAKGRFLDFHSLTEEQREIIRQWGLESRFITLETLYKYVIYNEEGEEMYGLAYSYKEAFEEVNDEELVFELPNRMVPTEKMKERVLGSSLINTLELLCTVYVEDVLHLDGVWFHDVMDRNSLSAPRGVIVLNQIDSWTIEEVSESVVPIWGSRYEE